MKRRKDEVWLPESREDVPHMVFFPRDDIFSVLSVFPHHTACTIYQRLAENEGDHKFPISPDFLRQLD